MLKEVPWLLSGLSIVIKEEYYCPGLEASFGINRIESLELIHQVALKTFSG